MTKVWDGKDRIGTLLLGITVFVLLLYFWQMGSRYVYEASPTETYQAQVCEKPEIMPIQESELMAWVNQADVSALTDLPEIGDTLAAAIAADRELHGPFHYPEDLTMVNGIGRKKLKHILDTFIIPDIEE